MTLKGGALVIGSLLWDSEMGRPRWRRRLKLKEKFKVFVPIRYGRLSKSRERKGTYTMVFSAKCYSSGYELGTGWVIPLNRRIHSPKDLRLEAYEMGKVEGFMDGISESWGTVALLLNPLKEIERRFKDAWAELMSTRLKDHDLFVDKLKSEKPPIDSYGLLSIKWPGEVNTESIMEDIDFLLATVTCPILVGKGKRSAEYKYPRYPSVHQIAEAIVSREYDKYFRKNVECGIATFQDERILRILEDV